MTDGQIVDIDVTQEMETSFLEYAYSVIYSRALPDARDGLKPVQRRILYQMSEMGLRPDRPYVKSSRIVGDVMGKLHPHSDTAIYDALVRMAQSFVMRVPLVDGHGNFGSLDDGPAAPRYTEARLDQAAMHMLRNLDEDTVNTVPNYDGSLTQPEALPSALPNLLVNGASGIAVGMATNMAPHNPGEVIAAARHLIFNPDTSLDELMRFVPGPDLPTGGRIIGLAGVRDAYETGRGTFRTRATVKFENITPRRRGITVTELPYLVGPEKVIEKIKDNVQAKKLQGISSVDDYSDRKHGLRLVIGIKSGFNPEAVLEELYRLTPMEDSFGINNVCLVDGRPRTLGLKALLEVFIAHRIDVIRRRSEFRLQKALDRLHLVEGLLVAILDIDEVVQLIRSSDDAAQARTRLMDVFDLSEIQATYILDLQLRRLTKFSRIELEAERDELQATIEDLREILGDEHRLKTLVSDELEETAEALDTGRRTVLVEGSLKEIKAAGRKKGKNLQVADEPCWVLMSTTGKIARTATAGELSATGRRAANDALIAQIPSSTRGSLGALTNKGRVHKIDIINLPSLPDQATRPVLSGGVKITDFIELERGEQVITLIDPTAEVVLGTRLGVVKRVAAGEIPNNRDVWDIIALKGKDTVVGAGQLPNLDVGAAVFITQAGNLLNFTLDGVRAQGPGAGGVAGIRLPKDIEVISFSVVDPAVENRVVTIAKGVNFNGEETESVKVSLLSDFPAKGRATAGMRSHRFLKDETELVTAFAGPNPQAAAKTGGARALPDELSRRDGSGAPVEGRIDAIGTLPRTGIAADPAAADGTSAEGTAPAGGGAAAKSGAKSTAKGAAGAPDFSDDDRYAQIGRDKDDDSGVIVSHDDEQLF